MNNAADNMNAGAAQLGADATTAAEDAKTQSVAGEQAIQQTGGANTDALTGQADEASGGAQDMRAKGRQAAV